MAEQGAPVEVLSERDVVTVEGPDAVSYLQGQLSQDVAALAVGASTLSFLLEPQGRIVAVLRVARSAVERLELDVEPGLGETVLTRLLRFKLRTKAEIGLVEGVVHLVHRGGGAAPEGALVPTQPGVSGWDARVDGDRTPVGAATDRDVLEAVRIVAGVPAAHDLDERTVPAETGLVGAAVSFTKGCYTGQELVARMDSRVAQPPRRIRRLSGSGSAPPAGAVAEAPGGTDAGTLTSVAATPDGWVALALVPRSVEGGEVLVRWAGGQAAATVEP